MAQNDLLTHFPFGATSRGMPVIGGGGRMTTGSVFFVGSTAAGASNNVNTHGTNPTTPFATLDFAVGACTASKGDIIFLMPGHVETINAAGGIDLDVKGISIIGLGVGRKRPVFTFSGSTTASLTVDDSDISIENVIFDFTGVDALIGPIDVNAADFAMLNCEIILATATNQAVKVFVTDSNASRMIVAGCYIHGSNNAGAESAFHLDGSPDGVEISENRIIGHFSNAAIYNPVGGLQTNLYIYSNVIQALGSTQFGINILETGSTGLIDSNSILVTDLTLALVNFNVAAINNKGYDSDTSNTLGTDVPIVGSQLGVGTSLIDQIIGNEFIFNRARFIQVTADFTSATWNTVAAHEILTVTGTIRLKIIPRCTVDLTSGGAATMILGTETTTNAFITSTTATDIDANELWLSATPNHQYARTAVIDVVITGGRDVGYTIGTAAMTNGSITFDMWWEPVSSDGNAVAGAGGAL